MATMIVTHRVASYDTWKAGCDRHERMRREAGFTAATLLRDHADPNVVTIVLSTPSLERAKLFVGSPELREAMQHAGVQGPPEIRFLEDVESTRY
jgi:hypothetical protein